MNNLLANKQLVIFDLDDTLVYTPKEIMINRIKTVLNKAGLPQKEESEISYFYDSHDWDNVIRSWDFDDEEFNRFWETYIHYSDYEAEDSTLIFPDTLPCLNSLKERNMKIALITSATPVYTKNQLKKMGWRYFDFWSCVGAHANISAKPDPQGVLTALSYLNLKLEDSAVVGDSYLDIEMAKNAGCLDILISRKDIRPSIKSTFTIKSLSELIS